MPACLKMVFAYVIIEWVVGKAMNGNTEWIMYGSTCVLAQCHLMPNLPPHTESGNCSSSTATSGLFTITSVYFFDNVAIPITSFKYERHRERPGHKCVNWRRDCEISLLKDIRCGEYSTCQLRF